MVSRRETAAAAAAGWLVENVQIALAICSFSSQSANKVVIEEEKEVVCGNREHYYLTVSYSCIQHTHYT